MKKSVAIIPARGGSKRIPHKNIKEFLGKPIIAYTIELALNSKLFEKVVVTTDDDEIALIARKYGAEVPFFRPSELSDDTSGSGDAVQHALAFLQEQGESYEYLCTLYATAPLLQEKYLCQAYQTLKDSNAHMAFSATSMPFPIQRTFKITDSGRCKMFWPENFSKRSQDFEVAYQDAGQFYWENLSNSFTDLPFGKDSIPVIIPRDLVQDIDTLEDWQRAETLYKIHHKL